MSPSPKLQSLPKLKQKAWDLFSERLKVREMSKRGRINCYTCDSPVEYRSLNCQAGHYLPRGAYPGLTFHSDNVRVQCKHCNEFLGGNTEEFRRRLVKELGEEAVISLEEIRHIPLKLSRSDYEAMIKEFNHDIVMLKRNI